MACCALGFGQNAVLDEAKTLYDQGHYQKAIAILDQLIEGEDDVFEALHLKGNCFQKQDKFVAAVQEYEQAEQLNHRSPDLLAHLGAAYINLTQYKEAEKKLKSALKQDPHHSEAHYFMGNVKYFTFNNTAALKHYDEAIKENPAYRDALYMRAAAHAEMGKYHMALRDYEAVLEIDPQLAVARFNIAVIMLHNDQYDKATELMAQVSAEDLPNPADYYFNLAEANYFGGDREAACELYRQAMELGDADSGQIYEKYCNRGADQEKEEELRTRTIRMAF